MRAEEMKIGELTLPVRRFNTVILGAGAAGMNCAVHLHEFPSSRGVATAAKRIAVVTAGRQLGASRMSGSDKQTYYKLGTSPAVPDCAMEFAKALTAGGCAHGDLALAEAQNSLREFFHLVQAGVPFPHDTEGAYIGYKTDHDPAERATSAGPKTSRFMSECLERQARGYGIPIFDGHHAAHLLTDDRAGLRRIVGLVTLDRRRLSQPDHGMTVFLCENLVLAAGGPGELFEVSVYPRGQIGVHGLAFKAGLRAANMTEWQFGLASTKFRWNVSGTYMQSIPRIFSTDRKGGDARDFLAPHFPSTARLATAIFLKGYQWPFDAQRIAGHGSSLIDLLVTHERQQGRRVLLDFRENPRPGPGMKHFALEELEPEALEYLRRNGAMQSTPLARLAQMNAPAIELYREHEIDLATEPLEVAVCAQHHNGGFVVDSWWQSNIPHTFVIGEMAGTHGVKRPGGAALNAGQVGGLRAAEYIANVYGGEVASLETLGEPQRAQLDDLIKRLQSQLQPNPGFTVKQAIGMIQHLTSAAAGHIRLQRTVERALVESRVVCDDILSVGLSLARPSELPAAIAIESMALTHLALLEALLDYLKRGGGSRGSAMVLPMEAQEGSGVALAPGLICPSTNAPYAALAENIEMRNDICEIELVDPKRAQFRISHVRPRPVPRHDEPFERAWAAFRSGAIFPREETA